MAVRDKSISANSRGRAGRVEPEKDGTKRDEGRYVRGGVREGACGASGVGGVDVDMIQTFKYVIWDGPIVYNKNDQ
jgi:hypothetical protein